MVEGRTLTAAIMFAIFAVMVGLSLTYPADARFLPLVIGIPGLLLSALQLAIELRAKPDRDAVAWTIRPKSRWDSGSFSSWSA